MFGKVFNAAYGPTQYEVISLTATALGGGAKLHFEVLPQYTERYYAVYVNGQYVDSVRCGEQASFDVMLPLPISSGVNSVYVEDVGTLSQLTVDVAALVGQRAQDTEAATGNTLSFSWDNIGRYTLTPIQGDTQLSNVKVTGLSRGVNCQPIASAPTRARIYYSVENVAQ